MSNLFGNFDNLMSLEIHKYTFVNDFLTQRIPNSNIKEVHGVGYNYVYTCTRFIKVWYDSSMALN